MKNSRFMKHRYSTVKAFVAATIFLFAAAACTREHQCRCSHEGDGGHMQYLTVDRSLSCDDITEMSIERHIIDSVTGTPTLERVEIHKVSCHEYAED